jgi:carbon starvation protein
VQLAGFWRDGRYFLLFLDVLILVASLLVALEAVAAITRARKGPQPGAPEPGPDLKASAARSSTGAGR